MTGSTPVPVVPTPLSGGGELMSNLPLPRPVTSRPIASLPGSQGQALVRAAAFTLDCPRASGIISTQVEATENASRPLRPRLFVKDVRIFQTTPFNFVFQRSWRHNFQDNFSVYSKIAQKPLDSVTTYGYNLHDLTIPLSVTF